MPTHEIDPYLHRRLSLIADRVRTLVGMRRSEDPNPDDAFRGLYINEQTLDDVLADARPSLPEHDADALRGVEAEATSAASGEAPRLVVLTRAALLTPLDIELLLIALLPDIDSRFERLYGYLNDDVTRRRASIGLALEVAGAETTSASARARLSTAGALVELGLLVVEDLDRPYLTRALRVPDRVAAHLLGDDHPDPLARSCLVDVEPYRTNVADQLTQGLLEGVRRVHLREHEPGTGWAVGSAALHAAGRAAVVADLTLLSREAHPLDAALALSREALLRNGGLVAGPVEELAQSSLESLHRLDRWDVPIVYVGTATWDPRWSPHTPPSLEIPALGPHDRVALWRQHLGTTSSGVDPEHLATHLSLGPGQIAHAVTAATASAALNGGALSADDLRRGVRSQNASGLERLARRIEPEVTWTDLVLAPTVTKALQGLADRARHRDIVLSDWRMRRGGGRGRGVSALFAGDSGTGKTMSAEVIAADLGLDLYTVNLATVVDKYVGETEKNLERIFAEAGGVNAVLFFDEADAIFGKRSEVRDAHDRYANIESAYLLQRLETFDGLAILATNIRANIDDAFTRRLDAIIDFPAPTPELRERLWRQCLADPLPIAGDIDFDFCARSFELAGGNIRSASITAAYLAAAAGTPVGMPEVIAAVGQEYRKLGRLVLEHEFGEYRPLLTIRAAVPAEP
jgi:ATPase family protein associated with various cellular activities (AAA)/winged helix domain-containing protein